MSNIARVLKQIGAHLKVVYFLFDGELGHNDAMQMVRQLGLHVSGDLKLLFNGQLEYVG